MINEMELKAECVRKGISQKELASKLGIDAVTLYRRFKGESDFSRSELQMIRSILGLTDERFIEIFFTV
ncbi:MAG: helix-turn-helix transcriptional regulator [Anaerovibrio sp.]|uniref:helix-turn-helix domain-containing protein n=1 Tax=Anaerovibrio sp. TaxID=1872532 RepID=UPI001B083121|nr:helix-turn-helix transcriptional regulator [Anaerovibrio sp.]MBO6245929.1 helix-turn-helix transcriptional regulator [Anaerovibrio sp.]